MPHLCLHGIGRYQRAGNDPQKNREETDVLFAWENFQRALLDCRFVETEPLHTRENENKRGYYLRRMIDFYEAHGGAPCARQVIEGSRQMLADADKFFFLLPITVTAYDRYGEVKKEVRYRPDENTPQRPEMWDCRRP